MGLSCLLKKGTGSEPVSENVAKNNNREVPVPFFQQTARRRCSATNEFTG
jgi:hypothetical protein